jgi:hypothetical protein
MKWKFEKDGRSPVESIFRNLAGGTDNDYEYFSENNLCPGQD